MTESGFPVHADIASAAGSPRSDTRAPAHNSRYGPRVVKIRVASLRTKLRRVGRVLAAHNPGGLVLSKPDDAGKAQTPPAVDEQLERLQAYRKDLAEQLAYWVRIRSEHREAAQDLRWKDLADGSDDGPTALRRRRARAHLMTLCGLCALLSNG